MTKIEKIKLLRYLYEKHGSNNSFYRPEDKKLKKVESKEWKNFLNWGKNLGAFDFYITKNIDAILTIEASDILERLEEVLEKELEEENRIKEEKNEERKKWIIDTFLVVAGLVVAIVGIVVAIVIAGIIG